VKLTSGGQTGVDRAALDVALKHRIECGGWCPARRLDEFGRIPDRYPVQELNQKSKEGRSLDRPGGLETLPAAASRSDAGVAAAPWEKRGIFPERTLANVRDSDGTIIIYSVQLQGGTEYTFECCKQLRRPHQLLDASTISAEEAAKLISNFVHKHEIEILNVAGPRESEWPGGYEYASCALNEFLRRSAHFDRSKRGGEQIGT
jgi:hypothetical protein